MDPVLDKYMESKTDQIKYNEDGVINFIYLGHEEVETRHGNRIKIVVFDIAEQRETAIFTLAKGLLQPLFYELKVQINDKVAVKRTGEGFNTKYFVKILERSETDDSKPVTAGEQKKLPPEPPKQKLEDPF